MTSSLLVYTDCLTPRSKYILNHVLGNILGLNVTISVDHELALSHSGPLLCYSETNVNNGLYIYPHELLSETGISNHHPKPLWWHSIPAFFGNKRDCDLPFDLFAAAFYLLSRYEEYLPYIPDQHSRYPASESIASTLGFLEIPVVDLWAKALGEKLKGRYPELELPERRFTYVPTVDIDNAFAYKYKGIARSLMGTAKSLLNLRAFDVSRRLAVYLGLRADPYDTYSKLDGILSTNSNATFFILGGKPGPFDRHLPLTNRAMQELILTLSSKYNVGIHPSYGSWRLNEEVKSEIQELTAIIGKPVTKSRNHFLRFSIPDTYHCLASLGIKEDYSMGYPDRVGFRAGTSIPFQFYSLTQEKILPLMIIPFQAMDATLKHSMGLSPDEAVIKVHDLAKRTARVGGTFVTIWHNELLSGLPPWRGWQNVPARIMREIEKL